VGDSRDRPGRGNYQFPLPPPDEEGGTRVRLSADLTGTTARDVPMLPPDPTARFEQLDARALFDDDDDGHDDDRTMVDPRIPDDLHARAPAAPLPPAPPRAASLPLPPPTAAPRPAASPPRPAASPPPRAAPPLTRPRPVLPPPRATLPGTRRRRSAMVEDDAATRRVPKQPPPPPPGRSASPPAKAPTGEQNTAVAADPLAPLAAPLVGGRYRVVQRIGQGGMGKVYKVTHGQLGKTFALKIISTELTEEGKARDLFYREARLASSLSHPNIASVVDFGEDDELGAFMVMEFLEGEPLNRTLHREKRIGVRQACEIIEQVAEALHYIHSNKIVHCDIKTENILVCEVPGTKRRKQQIKLLDFGLARSTSAGRQTGSLSGTPHYVAPERIRGEDPSPPSDIYGLGILFYELLTGKVPWDGNVAQILCGHLELEPTPPSHLIDGGLDPALEKLVLRALAKTPQARHKDMNAFLYELRTVMDMLGIGRRGGKRSMRRVVIEKTENKRDEIARAVYDASRIPTALIARNGTILLANPAFAKFVMGVSVEIEGLMVQSTPLALAWQSWESDLARAAAGRPVRRVLELDVAPGETRRLMMWLDPGIAEDQAIFGVHPLDEG
jgi:tRNA A-37 threonylcarbamoyl transferase component Bud32